MEDDNFREKPVRNAPKSWLSDEFITEVRVLEVDEDETYAGKFRERLTDTETGEDETWVCLSDRPRCRYRH